MRESIELRLECSRMLCAVLGAAYFVALAALWWTLPAWLAAPMSAVLLGSAVAEMRRHALRTSRDAFIRLSVGADGVVLERRDGRKVEGRLDPGSIVLPWLAIVHLRPAAGTPAWAVVPGDCTAPAAHRRLRVFLRWRRAGAQGGRTASGVGLGMAGTPGGPRAGRH